MDRLKFPTGPTTALVTQNATISFDALHLLRDRLAAKFLDTVPNNPRRVLGCLNDDETALLALLTVTELTDYMPINSQLTDVETTAIIASSGADVAIVSKGILAQRKEFFSQSQMLVLDWDDIISAAKQDTTPSQATDIPCDGRLILHTSGTTGKPKRVPITVHAINASAANIAQGHNLLPTDLALNALPTFHIGALVDVLLAPFHVGGAVAISDQRSSTKLVAEIIKTRPTWVQIVPTILRSMVEELSPEVLRNAGSSLSFIRSVSAPVPPALKREAEALMGCPIVEMYGMTETAGQIATNGRQELADKNSSVGMPCNVPVAIMDGFGNSVETGNAGEVCVSGPTVFDGYEGVTKEDVFFGDWFRTGDLGRLDNDGYLFIEGRLKEMINIGGEKVSPHEIERAALTYPGVLEAAAYALPHSSLGEQAGLTIATSETINTADLLAHMALQLAPFKRPNTVLQVPQLPRLANAKVDRILLKRTATAALQDRLSGKNNAAVAQQMTHEAQVVSRLWVRILKSRTPENEDDFFDMGGDSLSATEFLMALEKELGREISPSQLFKNPRFAGLVNAVSSDQRTGHSDPECAVTFVKKRMTGWPGKAPLDTGLFRGIGPLKSGSPIFWATQNAIEPKRMAKTLCADRPLYFSRSLFGKENRTEADFRVLSEKLAEEINTLQPNGTITLGGFCGGAILMHLVADLLVAGGREIEVLISIDHWPERAMQFPVIQAMTLSPKYSARLLFDDCTNAVDLLYPYGVHMVDFDCLHQYYKYDFKTCLEIIKTALQLTKDIAPSQSPNTQNWSLEQRQRPFPCRIKVRSSPLLYDSGSTKKITVSVENISDQYWPETTQSGLMLAVDFLSVKGWKQKNGKGIAHFNAPVFPGETVQISFDVTFPTSHNPIFAQFYLVNQGVKRFDSDPLTRCSRFLLPRRMIFAVRQRLMLIFRGHL
jgi:acyl-CoA synthetase (AMP-forming)/AMP-acid ligase II/acyl carrier protein